jgi:hypothetical protein
MKLLRTISVGFDITDQIIVIFFSLRKILKKKKKKKEYNETVHQQFVDFKKAYDSVRKEVLYNILIPVWDIYETIRPIKI